MILPYALDEANIAWVGSGGTQKGLRTRPIGPEREAVPEEEFVGISVDFLSLIERGRNAPSFETIEHMVRETPGAGDGVV
jgi:hypothetical protein